MFFRRWLPLAAVVLIGCSGDDQNAQEDPADDSAVEAGAESSVDAGSADALEDASADTVEETSTDASDDGDATADAVSSVDADGTVDTAIDTAVDSSFDGGVDSVVDTAVDTYFTPPTWSPVCAPGATTDGGVDAAVDAVDASDAESDAADATFGDTNDADGAETDDAPADVEDETDATLVDSGGDAAVDSAADSAVEAALDGGACTATRVRIVASNLTSGSSQSYELPGIHILQGLHPDIALMQEFKYGTGMRALVDTAFDPTFSYATETSLGNIPNGIVSRYPILESGEWDDPDLTDRDWVWARIDVPGPIDLFAVSTHLRTTSATARDAEAKNLLAYIKAKVPAGVYLVIGGDFNTANQTEPALLTLSEVVSISSPYATDQAGVANTNQPRSKPYDWVLPNPLLLARMIPVSIGAASFPAGLVFDTRVYTPLSDVAPAVSTDSAATNMQHMAVVRDFALGD